MTTVLLWLLISVGDIRATTSTVAQFATAAECERVRDVIHKHGGLRPGTLACVQAHVAR